MDNTPAQTQEAFEPEDSNTDVQNVEVIEDDKEGNALVRQAWTKSATTTELEKYLQTGKAPEELDDRTRLVSGMARELAMALGARLEQEAEAHVAQKTNQEIWKTHGKNLLMMNAFLAIIGTIATLFTALPFIFALAPMILFTIGYLLYAANTSPAGFANSGRVKPILSPQDRFPIVKKAVKGLVSQDVEGVITTAIDDVYAISQATTRHPNIFDPVEAAEIGEMIGETLLAGALLTEIDAYKTSRKPLLQSKKLNEDELNEQQQLLEELALTRDDLDEQVRTTALRFSLIRGELLQLEAEALQGSRLHGSVENMLIEIRSLRDAMKQVNAIANGKLHELDA